MEVVAQGIANVASALFGGISVTGTIARTATNIRAGAVSPIAGMSGSSGRVRGRTDSGATRRPTGDDNVAHNSVLDRSADILSQWNWAAIDRAFYVGVLAHRVFPRRLEFTSVFVFWPQYDRLIFQARIGESDAVSVVSCEVSDQQLGCLHSCRG